MLFIIVKRFLVPSQFTLLIEISECTTFEIAAKWTTKSGARSLIFFSNFSFCRISEFIGKTLKFFF